ncbi:MAG: phasin family protein [Oleiphilaceae bacterium]
MQDAFKAQMDSTKKYSEFASSQFKTLSELRDTDSLQHFFKGQMEGFSELNEQLIEDLKSLVEREKSSNMALAQFSLILNLNKQMKNRVKQPKVHLKKK